MAATTDQLIIKIDVENDKALVGIDEVLAKLNSLNNAASDKSLSRFKELGGTLKDFAEATKALTNVDFEKLQVFMKALENMNADKIAAGVKVAAPSIQKLGESLKSIGNGGNRLAEASKGIGTMADALKGFARGDYTESVEKVRGILLRLAPAVSQAGKYGSQLNQMRIAIENLGPALRSFGKAESYAENIKNIGITVKSLANAIMPLKDAPVQQLKYLADALKKFEALDAGDSFAANMKNVAKGVTALVRSLGSGVKGATAEKFANFAETVIPPLKTMAGVLKQFSSMGVDENLGQKLWSASQGIVVLINTLTAGVSAEKASRFSELSGALSNALKPLSGSMSQLQKLGSIPELGSNLASAGKGIVAFINSFVSGASQEALARFAVAAETIGPAFKTLTGSLKNLTKVSIDENFVANMATAQKAFVAFVYAVNAGISDEVLIRFERLARAARDVSEALKRINANSANKIAEAAPSNTVIGRVNSLARHLFGIKTNFISAGDAAGSFGRRLFALPFTSLNNRVKGLSKAIQSLKSRIGRVVLLRLIRSAFVRITQAIRNGTNALYQWASAYGNSFKATMDSLASSFQYLRNSMAAAASPLIEALAPAINYVIDLLVNALNIFNQFVAAITGRGTWRKAVKRNVSYGDSISGIGDSASGAGDAVKEFEKQLMGFDEINNLTLPKDSGGGGGGGGGGDDFAGMFEEIDVASSISDWVSDLKNAWANEDWSFFENVGKQIGEKIISGLENIQWDSIQHTAEKLGKAIASTLNGVLEAEVNGVGIGEAIGTAIAESYNTWFTFVDAALSTFDFSLFGQRISEGIVAFFTDMDWDTYASTVTHFFTGLLDTMTGLLRGIPWRDVPFLIVEQIAEFFSGIPVADLAESIAEFIGTALLAVGNLLTGIGDLVIAINKAIIDYFKSYIHLDQDDNILDIGRKIIEGIWNGITDAIANAATWLWNNIFLPIYEGIKNAFGIASPASTMLEVGYEIIAGIWEGLKEKITSVIEWFKELPGKFKEAIGNIAITATATYEAVKGALWETMLTAWDKIKGAVTTAAATFVAKAGELWDKITTLWESLKGAAATAKATFVAEAGALWDKITGLWESITNAVTTAVTEFTAQTDSAWDAITGIWETLGNTTKDLVVNITGKIGSGISTILDKWNGIKGKKKKLTLDAKKKGNLSGGALKTIRSNWDKILGLGRKKSLTLTVSGVKTKIANLIAKIKDAWAGIRGGTKTLTIKLADFFTRAWSTVKTWIRNNAPAWLRALVGVKTGGILKGTHWHPVTAAATGGAFSSGQMFVAREAGPELVGTIGGNTAVMNNDQIVSSVSDGVYRAIMAAMGSSGGDIIIKVDNTVLGRAAINGINNVTRQQGRLMLDLG